MRQSYQLNSIQNELVPQDYQLPPPNLFSIPTTPTSKYLHSPSSQNVYKSPMTPKVHSPPVVISMTKASPRNLRDSDPRNLNDYNLKRREKLVVTSSKKRH